MTGERRDMPLPDTGDRYLAPFWAGTARGELLLKTCRICGYKQWPPASRCPECLSPEHDWVASEGVGSVWSVAVYDRALDPRFADQIPYTVVLVELDDGPRMIGRYRGAPDAVAIGQRVRSELTAVGAGVTLVDWIAATDETLRPTG